MLKKFIKRFLPDHHKIKKQKALKIFGSLLHDPNLWHLNRRSASGAFGLGLFFAFWPVPFQMWLSAGAAIPLRVNLPLSVATVWITNPFTMPPIFYGAYLVGATILGTDTQAFHFQLSWDWVVQSLETIGPAFLLGCGVCSIVFGLAGFFGLNYIWRWSVVKAWQVRQAKYAAKQAKVKQP
ncbi:DUF2062 domain-containing protein [Paraglaciecola mesophila]|jgi:uncharacterized protein (DUF2062 family)|uniref:DUF2062 domain-containing protein n=2 Tax=Paraglaciecola mesophila TaxID=197222 RepID=K6XUN0_9ALTE|nr:DUF2062 domain-containing protein [Paraglaciecola mesophila]GAC24299.1 hypothetical protein GMES_2003 [Paraglaciecola mesophila KMM 241]|tara:strand:+ start:292 stop:834 length:543 start_codon:yes stop_codon:yes gene_type:complete